MKRKKNKRDFYTTVQLAIESMGIMSCVHIIVRERTESGPYVLGGGYADEIIDRYGDMTVDRSFVTGDSLYIDVI